jgi:hypothetical protein
MNIDQKIQEAVAQVDLRKPDTFFRAANAILTEDEYVKSGDSVSPIDDSVYPYEGQLGTVVGPSGKGTGFVDVRFANGTVVPMQSSLLIKV